MDAAHTLEIHELVAQYGHAIDSADWSWFAGLFIATAELDYTAAGAPAALHGIDEILGYFRSVNHPSAHHAVNVAVVELNGEVTVRSKWFAPYTRGTHDVVRWAGGHYLDTVVHTTAGWRFSRKTCTRTWQMAHAAPGTEVPLPRRSF